MENEVLNFICQHIDLTAEEKKIFLDLNCIRSFKKGEILLKQGQQASECYFVLKGCLKSFYLNDGYEQVTDLYVENDPITPTSYLDQNPSTYYISCIENSILSIGNNDRTSELFDKIPKMQLLSNTVNLNRISKKQIEIDELINFNPEQRYVMLLEKRPDLIHRVPQYTIASYLGIKPESLSRIRKRLAGIKGNQ